MALSISETWESGSGSLGRDGSDEYSAIVIGDPVADHADDPRTVMLFAVPKFSLVSSLGNIVNNFRRVRVAEGTWIVTAEYRSPTEDRQTNDASFSLVIGEGNQHITHSIKTVQGYGVPNGPPVPNFNGCIGVDQDGNVAGTDLDFTTQDLKTAFYIAPANMTQPYADSLETLRGSVNSDTVTMIIDGITRTYAPGELRYRHCDMSKRKGFGDWEACLNWSVIRNSKNLTIGPITGIAKNGWDLLWVLYQPQADNTAKMRVPTPIAAYVEQVFPYAPLTPLIKSTTFGQANTQGWSSPSDPGGAGVTGS